MKIVEVESKLTENSQETQQVLTKLFNVDQDGYLNRDDFFIDEQCTTKRDGSSIFFPSYHFNGDMKSPLYTKNQNSQLIKWVPFVNKRITNFLEDQQPGSTDLCIPLCTSVDGVHYVYTGDGACGDSLATFVKGQHKKAQVCKMIIEHHFDEMDDEDDEDY